MEYTVIKQWSQKELIEDVNKHIALGWKPVGGVFMWDQHMQTYLQAMIKEDSAPETTTQS